MFFKQIFEMCPKNKQTLKMYLGIKSEWTKNYRGKVPNIAKRIDDLISKPLFVFRIKFEFASTAANGHFKFRILEKVRHSQLSSRQADRFSQSKCFYYKVNTL